MLGGRSINPPGYKPQGPRPQHPNLANPEPDRAGATPGTFLDPLPIGQSGEAANGAHQAGQINPANQPG